MALTRLVITVAAQNLICPHGSTYPRNAVKIEHVNNNTPTIHTFFNLKLLKKIPRKIWKYISKKNRDAPFAWVNRKNHPSFTSRIIKSTLKNEKVSEGEKWKDKKIPVIIWIIKQIPNMDPKFQKNLKLEGDFKLYKRSLIKEVKNLIFLDRFVKKKIFFKKM